MRTSSISKTSSIVVGGLNGISAGPYSLVSEVPFYLPILSVFDQDPSNYAVSVEAGKAIRCSAGTNGRNFGRLQFSFELEFQNLGASALFNAIGRVGVDLATASEIKLTEITVNANDLNTNSRGRLRVRRIEKILLSDLQLLKPGVTYFDASILVTCLNGNRNIQVNSAYADIIQITPPELL